ncbi:small-conductance mechanosensitive channel MscS [Arcobacter sp. 15-2]|uniref:mechanosensitive ion channel family protein n=1 Tax=Arcobacter sp. 15-2 TaxID=3374109 RepID=UPI00399C96CA
MNNIIETLAPYALNFVIAVIIFIIGKYAAKILTSLFKKFLDKSNVNETLKVFLGNIVYGLLLIVVVLSALNQLGIQTTSFVAILGAIGLAVGLAFQGTLSNISAGVMIVIFRPINIGDFVEAGGVAGTIEEINLFNTIFKTPDNKVIIVSNSNIIGGNIINYSKKDTRRVDFVFGIGYEDDLKLAKNTLLEIVNDDKRVLQDPEPFVAVKELGDSSVNFVVRVWVKSEDYWGVHFDTMERVKLTFDNKGISIPYPQMDIHTNKIQ